MTNKMGQKKMRLEEKEHDKALRRACYTTMIKQTFFRGRKSKRRSLKKLQVFSNMLTERVLRAKHERNERWNTAKLAIYYWENWMMWWAEKCKVKMKNEEKGWSSSVR